MLLSDAQADGYRYMKYRTLPVMLCIVTAGKGYKAWQIFRKTNLMAYLLGGPDVDLECI